MSFVCINRLQHASCSYGWKNWRTLAEWRPKLAWGCEMPLWPKQVSLLWSSTFLPGWVISPCASAVTVIIQYMSSRPRWLQFVLQLLVCNCLKIKHTHQQKEPACETSVHREELFWSAGFTLWSKERRWCCLRGYVCFTSLLCKTTHTFPYKATSTHKCTHMAEGGRTSKANNGILLPWDVMRPLLTSKTPRHIKTAWCLWWAEWKYGRVWQLPHQLTVTSVHSLHLSLHPTHCSRRRQEADTGLKSKTNVYVCIESESFISNIIAPRLSGIRHSCVILGVSTRPVSDSHIRVQWVISAS